MMHYLVNREASEGVTSGTIKIHSFAPIRVCVVEFANDVSGFCVLTGRHSD